MKLLTIDEGRDGATGAMLASGEIVHFGRAARPGTVEAWLPDTMRRLLAAGDEGLAIARRLVDRHEAMRDDAREILRRRGAILAPTTRLRAPVPDPRLVVAAGLAYRSHLAEMSGTPAPPHPTGFMKSPTSITDPDAGVAIPPTATDRVDYEGELAIVFGRDCHGVDAEEAMDCVAGFTIANDVSARDWVHDVWQATTPWDARRTWEVNIMGKQFPTFTPLGPVLLTSDVVDDVRALRLTTRLNGQVVQDAPIGDLLFDLADTIAWFSRWYTFSPGDVLLTGTPAGVGVGRKPALFMRAGDTIEVSIDRIGTLRNRITTLEDPVRFASARPVDRVPVD